MPRLLTPGPRNVGWICRTAMKNIWPRVGSSEFTYQYIADDIDSGPGILKRMHNDGVVIPVGKASTNGNTKLWKFSPSTIKHLKNLYGPVKPEIEAACQEYNAKVYARSLELSAIASSARTARFRKKTAEAAFNRNRALACQIWIECRDNPFRVCDLFKQGMHVSIKQTSREMLALGFFEKVGNHGYYKLTPAAIPKLQEATS